MRKITRFSDRLLSWYDAHGRKTLPWQLNKTPYRVWLSEIMLQQTQVATVIDYFNRFIETFPTVFELANADTDRVLALWTGLGYYARARNLHKTALMVVEQYNGKFPKTREALETLPGIGRSTAAAICALAHHQAETILDGNVKRVFARLHGVAGWPGEKTVLNQLWEIALKYTPKSRNADYTQALMDLGATLCKPKNPECSRCPFQKNCIAALENNPEHYPGKKPRQIKPVKQITFLMILNSKQEFLLEKRKSSGIWGGLWSFPEKKLEFKIDLVEHQRLTPFRHTFTHFHLDIEPVLYQLNDKHSVAIPKHWAWYSAEKALQLGLAAPVVKLLKQSQVLCQE